MDSRPKRRRIEKSRIDATHSLVQACAKAKQRPQFLINASAVGYYGPHGDETITEEIAPGTDFLSVLCRDWEEEAKKAEELRHARRAPAHRYRPRSRRRRIGKMALPFKYFVGGALGSGQQWMSWIHLEDLVGLIVQTIDDPRTAGPVNATAPTPVRNKEFCQTLAKVMHRPCWAHASPASP